MSTDYRAKRHPALEALRKDLAKGLLEEEVSVNGHKFKITTLNEDEETWADAYMRTGSPAAMLSSRRAPRLAAAIKAINGISVEELFNFPDDMPKVLKDRLNDNAIEKKFWIRDQVLMFLAEDGNRPFISELYSGLTRLDEKRDEAIKAIPNS